MEEITSQLNLSETTSQIFSIILMKGCVSASSVAVYLDMKIRQVEKGIKELENNHLVRKASGKIPRYIPLPPFKGFVSYLGDYTNNINETITQIQEIDRTKTVNFDKISKKTSENLGKQLDTLLTETKKKNSTLEETMKKATEIALTNVEAAEIKATEKTNGQLNTTLDALKNDFTSLNEDLTKDLDTHNLLVKEIIEKIPNNLDQQFTETLGERQSSLTDAKTKMGKETEDRFIDIKGEITNFMRDFDTKVNQLKNSNKTILQTNEADFHTFLDDTNTILSQTLNKSVTQTQSLITALQKETTTTLDDFLTLHSESTDTFSTETRKMLTDLKQTIGKSLQEYQTLIVDQAQYQYSEANHRLADKHIEIKDNLTKVIATSIQEMTGLLSDISGKISVSVEQIQNQLTTGKDTLITSVQEKLAHQTTVFTDFMDGFLNNYKQMGIAIEAELHQEISDKISDLHGITAEFLDDFSTDVDSAKDSIRDQFRIKEEENLAFLDQGVKTLTTEYDTLSSALKTHITKTTTQCSTNLTQSLETAEDDIETLTTTNSKEITDKITAVQSQISVRSDTVRKEITENGDGETTAFKEKIGKVKTDLRANLVQHRETEEKSLGEIVAGHHTRGKSHIEALKSQLDTLLNTHNSNIDEQLTGLGQFKDKATQILIEKGTSIKDAVGTTISNMKADFDSLLGSKSTDLASSLGKILETHTAQMKDTIETFTGTLGTANLETSTIFKELEDLFGKTIEMIKTGANESINTGKIVLNEELGKVFESALTTMGSVKELGEEPIKILESAWKTMTSIDVIQAEKTWHLVGDDAIYPYVESMIHNVKSKLTLVLPSWENLPVDALMAKKARMTIITSVPPGDSNEQIDKLKEKGAQIMDYSGEDFIAIDRDGEELLFAPVSKESNPTIAIISEVEPMIRIVGSMISDYWRSKARKL